MLYGDSGAGKSSLINAGLIPEALDLGFVPERIRVQPRSEQIFVVERITASDEETDSLRSVLTLEQDAARSARSVLSAPELRERLRDAAQEHRLLLIFDQFEEIVTLFGAPGTIEAQRQVIDLINGCLHEALAVKVVLVFREDYLARSSRCVFGSPELVDQALRLMAPVPGVLPTIIRGPF